MIKDIINIYNFNELRIKRNGRKSKIEIKEKEKENIDIFINKNLDEKYNYKLIKEKINYQINNKKIKTERITLEEKVEHVIKDPSTYKGFIFYTKDEKGEIKKKGILCPIRYTNKTEKRNIDYKCIFKYGIDGIDEIDGIKDRKIIRLISFSKYNIEYTIPNLSLNQLIRFNLKEIDLEDILKEIKKGKKYNEIENKRFQEWNKENKIKIVLSKINSNKLV